MSEAAMAGSTHAVRLTGRSVPCVSVSRLSVAGFAVAWCVTLAAPMSQQTPRSAAARADGAPSGALSGVVREANSARPLAGVIISLTSTDRDPNVNMSVITDDFGRFVLRRLPPSASYVLAAAKLGYYATGGIANRDGLAAGATRIALADGQWISNVDIVMARWGAIRGTVVDEKGEAVVGVPVRAIAQIFVAGLPHLAAGPITVTDDRGTYAIAKLRRGRYFIAVPSVQAAVPASAWSDTGSRLGMGAAATHAAGLEFGDHRLVVGNYATPPPSTGRPRVYPPLFYVDAIAVTGAVAIDLMEGEERESVDLTLRPYDCVRVSGRVVGPPEALAGFVLRLMPAGSEDLGMGSEQATAVVAAGGVFAFLGVPAGAYTIQARRSVAELVRGAATAVGLPTTPGWARGTATGQLVSSAPSGTELAIRASTVPDAYDGGVYIVVGADDVTGVEVPLNPTATLSGRIVYDSSESAPDPLVSPFADPANGSAALGVVRPRSDLREFGGSFAIQGLRAGEYFLRVRSGSRWTVKSITAQGQEYLDRPFDMSFGDIGGVVVTMTDRGIRLSGFVRDRQGEVVSSATVIVFPVDTTLWTRFGFDPPRIKSVACFAGRGYEVIGLAKGAYYVVAVDHTQADGWQNPEFFRAARPLSTRVSLEWGDARRQDLTLSTVTTK